MAASAAIGLEVLDELMQAEVTELAGSKGKHDPGRDCYQNGSEDGSVTLGGRKVEIRRPRVRTADGTVEVSLTTYETTTATDLLAEHMSARCWPGCRPAATPAALESVGDHATSKTKATSKSSVSRQFVTATAERLEQLISAPLDDERWAIVYVSGG